MSLKFEIDRLKIEDIYQYIKDRPNILNDKIILESGDKITIFYYLIKKFDKLPLHTIKLCLKHNANINDDTINWSRLLTLIDKDILDLLLQNKLMLKINSEQYLKIIIELLIKADIAKILILYKHDQIGKELIIESLQTSDLIVSSLNYLYFRIGQICRQYQLNSNEELLVKICQIEKQYINLFKLIKNNQLELKDITDINLVTQMVFNTYLYHLINYFTDLVDHCTLINVYFYHYSNFPIINKIIMSPIYNDSNFTRIELLLKEKLFIKKIIKKKLGKKTIKYQKNEVNLEQCKIEIKEIDEE